MDAAALDAIADVTVLRALVREQVEVIAQRDVLLAERDRSIHTRDLKIDRLTHELARLRRLQYAARSERMDPAQRELFDEAMAADIAATEAELDALRELSPAPEPAARRAPQRRALPADLPRVETVHEPACCDCTSCGAALVKIGEHVAEKLDVEPLKFFVRRDMHPQYACRRCERIVAAPVAPAILDRDLAALACWHR